MQRAKPEAQRQEWDYRRPDRSVRRKLRWMRHETDIVGIYRGTGTLWGDGDLLLRRVTYERGGAIPFDQVESPDEGEHHPLAGAGRLSPWYPHAHRLRKR